MLTYATSQVFVTLVCMAVVISKTEINWGDAFDGFVPSKTLFQSGSLYTCTCRRFLSLVSDGVCHQLSYRYSFSAIGIVGATVMPHSLFLGSALAKQDRVSAAPPAGAQVEGGNASSAPRTAKEALKALTRFVVGMVRPTRANEGGDDAAACPKTHADWVNRPLAFVREHLYHGIVDMVVSLLGLAVVINAMWVHRSLRLRVGRFQF